MRTHFRLYMMCSLALMCVLSAAAKPGNAQTPSFLPNNLESITPENMHSIQQLAMLGTGTIQSIAWSPDSQQLAAAGSAGIRVFDVDHLEADPMWFLGHGDKVNDVTFSSDGSQLISVSNDQTVQQWDVTTGAELSSFCPFYNGEICLSGSIGSVALSPDGNYIALGLSSGVTVMTSSLSEEVATLVGEDGSEIQFSADGSLLASRGGNDGDVSIWQVNGSSFVLLREITVPFAIWDFAFSPAGDRIALACFFSEEVPGVQVFDPRTGEHLMEFEGGGKVAIDPTGTLLATLDAVVETTPELDIQITSFIRLYSLETSELLESLSVPYSISSLRFSPDGTKLAAGYKNGGIGVWEIPGYALLGTTEGRGAAVRQIALWDNQILSLDGLGYDVSTLADGGTNKGDTLRLWDLESGLELQSWLGADIDPALATILTVVQIPGTSYFIFRDEYTPFYIWNVANNTVVAFDTITPFPAPQIVFSDSGNRMVTFGFYPDFQHQTIFVWDVTIANGTPQISLHTSIPAIFENTDRRLYTIALSPDGSEVVGATFDGHVRIWTIETGEIRAQEVWGDYVSYNPDGTIIAVNGGRSLNLYDANTLEPIARLQRDEIGSGSGALFNHQGNLIVSFVNNYGFGGSIALWDVSDEYEPVILPASATEIVFSVDDTLMISAGYDGTIRLWGVRSQ